MNPGIGPQGNDQLDGFLLVIPFLPASRASKRPWCLSTASTVTSQQLLGELPGASVTQVFGSLWDPAFVGQFGRDMGGQN